MPKLVIKQDLPESSAQEKLEGVLRVILPLLLLGITAVAALSLYWSREPAVSEFTVSDAAQGLELPAAYTQQDAHLLTLMHEFEAQDKAALESYDQHSSLVAKADAILSQLSLMDSMAEELGISAQHKQILLTRHQYQKDYWEAKRVFHNLRLSRFHGNASVPVVVTEQAPAVVDNGTMAEAAKEAKSVSKSAPNVALPDDFCPLFGPGAAACKPGADVKKP